MNRDDGMTRSVGALGAAVTLIGFVIGISIFILPGSLAASTGPAVVLSYLIAAVLAVFTCVVAAQLGVIFPVSGASFVAVSSLVSPFWGFVLVWMMFGGVAVGAALLAFGFADYLRVFVPSVDRSVAAAGIILGLGGLNLLGIRDTVIGQTLMVAAFMIALAAFCAAGLWHMDTALLQPFVPNGLGPVVLAAIPAAFSYSGFVLIMEIGGEIKEPVRNIPRALALSFGVVLVTYTLVSLTLTGILPWQELGASEAPVSEAAARMLPDWLAQYITLTTIAAAATSINALLLAYSRDVLALARVRLLPAPLGRISARHGEPVYGVIFLTALALSALSLGGNIAEYATLAVVSMLVLQILIGVAVLRLPWRMPERYAASAFRLPLWLVVFFSAGLVLLSVGFLVIALRGSVQVPTAAGAFFVVGACYYGLRARWLRLQGLPPGGTPDSGI
ncbi:APC family permease [Lentisalinibacter sediminis]|uniref:APC family permease n=2 Tax=Lentisalinibacter sediminis TaxID=2992237 RepID=UPI00386A934E